MAAEEENTTSFKSLGLCDQLMKAVAEQQWKSPTPIQAEVISHALEGKDLIALFQTGSGKTGAFALPILQALFDSPQPFFALVLSPTRELALQIDQQFQALGPGIGTKSVALVGGESEMQQSTVLAKRPHIIVATPGRLLHHLTKTRGFSLGKIKYLVLDEADRLLGEEFQKPTNEILKVIPHGGERRTYLFSATMTNKVKKVARAGLRDPVKIEVASKYSTVETLQQQMMSTPVQYKGCYLVYLLKKCQSTDQKEKKCQRRAMVFTEKCAETPFLACMLQNLGIKAIPLHGKVSQSERVGALNMFKAGQSNVFVCTNLPSRGLDIPSVDMVINYNMPENPKVKKVERTGLRNPVKDSYVVYILTEKCLCTTIDFTQTRSTEKCQCTTMVFTETRSTASFLALMLQNLGIKAIPLHGEMSQSKRFGALNLFKAGQYNVLVCTDVACRGLDIPSVDMVINYNIPKNPKTYIHREGRTARAGRSGVAVSLVNQYEPELYYRIELLIGKMLPEFLVQDEEVLQFEEGVKRGHKIGRVENERR